MSPIEKIIIDFGFSWQFSKLFPYLMGFPLLFISWYFLKRYLKPRFFKVGVMLFFISLPILHFAFYPIYQGDLNNESTEHDLNQSFDFMTDNDLVVIVIPGCPFCLQSLETVKALKKRNKRLRITCIVADSNPTSLESFNHWTKLNCSVQMSNNLGEAMQVSNGKFPTFVIRTGKKLKSWNYSKLGANALDQIEHNP